MTDERLRALPAVELLVESVLAAPDADGLPRSLVVEAARAVLDAEREALRADAGRPPATADARRDAVLAAARIYALPAQERVINATGVVLHTNLGRAPLSAAAREAVAAAARGYLTLEYDPGKGERSHRAIGVERWLVRLTGAEAACVVNNGAAALLLTLSALATGRKVVVSRGELVEIGGSFRLPEILRKAGATLVEVGTTNRTRLDDYRRAIGPDTAVVLRVHPSNFRVTGFSERPSRGELAALAHEHGLPLIEDVGSGALVDTREFGLEHEPTVSECLTEGADLVTFSGDKLLGGPQAGLVVGRREWIAKIARDPLARALRTDKLTIAALEATLAAYADPDRARRDLPVLAALGTPQPTLRERAHRLGERLAGIPGLEVRIAPEAGEVGGGALPGARLAGFAVGLTLAGRSASALERRLRQGRPPIIARVHEDRVLLDVRTIEDGELDEIAHLVRDAVRPDEHHP